MLTGMTRTSRRVRLVATAVVTLAVLPLTGCIYAQIPADVPVVDVPADEPDPTASDDPIDEPSGALPATMSFTDGNALPSTAYIQWGDGLMFDEGWKSVVPDDGNGSWTDGTVDDTCTARFWQGYTSDVATTPGDDSLSSDAMLAQLLGEASAATVTPLATTTQLSYQSGANPVVDARQVIGADGDRNWMIAARSFTATGAGVYVVIECTGVSVETTFADVVAQNAVIIVE
jgi:hypothetical protein